MPKLLKNIAQSCMDEYYQTFKSDFQFFDLEDFIENAGNAASAIYQRYFELQYKDLRSERKDEVVVFDPSMLSEQVLSVKNETDKVYASLDKPVMSFMYDQNGAGVQMVYNDSDNTPLERMAASEEWSIKYMPKTNRIFYFSGVGKIYFKTKGDCPLKTVRVVYVPSMNPDALISDGIADEVIQKTIMQMRQLADKKVVKKSLDNNENMVPETEIDKQQLR